MLVNGILFVEVLHNSADTHYGILTTIIGHLLEISLHLEDGPSLLLSNMLEILFFALLASTSTTTKLLFVARVFLLTINKIFCVIVAKIPC